MTNENLNIIETIDCTPTWESILPLMLDLYAQDKNKIKSSYKITEKTKQAIDNCNNLLIEFTKMAQAADAWNEHIKTLNK
jgi:hypothetical protein